jgi:hypothetical protein
MSFSEYYQFYLTLHQNRWNRRLHIAGQMSTIFFVGLVAYFELWLLLALSPFIVYPFAWSGHYFFEKNTPAAFSNPLWAKACDWVMLKDILTGKISF